jgi:hypothetical protein
VTGLVARSVDTGGTCIYGYPQAIDGSAGHSGVAASEAPECPRGASGRVSWGRVAALLCLFKRPRGRLCYRLAVIASGGLGGSDRCGRCLPRESDACDRGDGRLDDDELHQLPVAELP